MRSVFPFLVLILVLLNPVGSEELWFRPQGVETLHWMSGRWGNSEQEEHWSLPKGKSMLGYHRDFKQGQTIFFEFLRIEESDGGLVYWASPKGGQAIPFLAKKSAPGEVLFVNYDHDFPKEIHYWREGDTLRAQISDGASKKVKWTWEQLP